MPTSKITFVTLGAIRRVFSESGISWYGALDDVTFLKRLYDLASLPSNDSRYRTAEEDIAKHRFANDDWSEDYIFSDPRFLAIAGDDEILRFLCETLHPEVRSNPREAHRLRRLLNRHLRIDGIELYEESQISGRAVFAVRHTRSPAKDLLSRKTLRVFRDHFARNYVLATIAIAFEDEDIEAAEDFDPQAGGERRHLVDRYYRSIDLKDSDDVAALLRVFAGVLEKLGASTQQEDASILKALERELATDGFVFERGKLTRNPTHPSLPHADRVAAELDAVWVRQQIHVMQSHEETHPALAIGTAKELIETVCKTILREHGQEVGRGLDLPQLIRATVKVLRLAPDDIPDTAKAADIIRRLLQNFATIAQNLAELRQLYGTGHGPEGRAKGLQPRHARLATGSAATVATFLLETHEMRAALSISPSIFRT